MNQPDPKITPPAGFTQAASWNQRFEAEGFLFGTEPNHWLRQHAVCWPAGSRVLCVADGEGRNSVWLARQGLTVDAFDVSERALAKSATLAAEAGVTVSRALSDCDQWPWTADTYDVVAGIFIQFADPEMRQRQFAGMVRTLKRGGLLVLQGYGPKQLEYKTGGPGQLAHLYTEELLRVAFGELQILELKDYEAELSEGARHTGMSHLLGLVARKP
jgi:SAM-dependent methyltransferase